MATNDSGKAPNFLMIDAKDPPNKIIYITFTLNVLKYDIDQTISFNTIYILHYVVVFEFLEESNLLMKCLMLLITYLLH